MKPVPQQGGRTSRRAHAPDSGDKCVVGSSEDDGSDREGELDSEAQARSLVTGAPLPGKAPPPAKPCFRRLLSNRLIGAGVAAMSLCAFSSLSVFVTLSVAGSDVEPMPVGMTAFPCDDLVSTMPCDAGQWRVAPLADCGARANATRVAVLGGYGSHDGGCSQRVAALLRQVERQFGRMHAVLTTGGNNFPHGDAKTLEPNVATPYGRFFEAGERPAFFPTLGAADFDRPFDAGGPVPYLRFFRYLATLPGPEAPFLRGQAYRASLAGGAVDVFTINSNLGNPEAPYADLTKGAHAQQFQWLRSALANSTARWRIVTFHHSPYSSSRRVAEAEWMRWPLRAWGASLVLTGSQHVYERLSVGSPPLTHVINGLGGHPWRDRITNCRSTRQDSQVRYAEAHGVQVLFVESDVIRSCFYSTEGGGTLVDAHTVHHPAAAPSEAADSAPGGHDESWWAALAKHARDSEVLRGASQRIRRAARTPSEAAADRTATEAVAADANARPQGSAASRRPMSPTDGAGAGSAGKEEGRTDAGSSSTSTSRGDSGARAQQPRSTGEPATFP